MPAEARWKPSCFNIHVDHDGKRLFFNSVDSRILELSGGKRECFEEALREVEEKGHCAGPQDAELPEDPWFHRSGIRG